MSRWRGASGATDFYSGQQIIRRDRAPASSDPPTVNARHVWMIAGHESMLHD